MKKPISGLVLTGFAVYTEKISIAGYLVDQILTYGLCDTLKRRNENVGNLGQCSGGVSIAEGFVTASLMFCVGAMTIVGSLQSGLTGDHQMLFTKSMLDFVSSMIFASSLGLGVLFAAGFVLVFQGGITLLAGLAAPFLGDAVIAEMTCVGSVLIIGLGLNMLGLTKLKVMNYLPAIFLPILLCLLW